MLNKSLVTPKTFTTEQVLSADQLIFFLLYLTNQNYSLNLVSYVIEV